MLKLPRFYTLSLLAAMLFGMIIAACIAPTPAPVAGEPEASPAAQGEMRDVRIVVVTHGQAADPFWSVVKRAWIKPPRICASLSNIRLRRPMTWLQWPN